MDLKALYETPEIQNEIKIQIVATQFIRTLIEMYVNKSEKADISYFFDLVRLSINYSIAEKRKILTGIGVQPEEIENEIDKFNKSIESFKSEHNWENGSLVGSGLVRTSGKVSKEDDFNSFIIDLKKLLNFFIKEPPDKKTARNKLLELIPSLNNESFITFNSLGAVIYPLCPEAFPLTNKHVQVGYNYFDIKLIDSDTKNYLSVAQNLEEKVLQKIGISENDYHFGVIDRLFSEMCSKNDKKLAKLYSDLIIKRKPQLQSYYDSNTKIYEKVDAERERLSKPNELVDGEFVLNLFIGDGVASKGQSQSTVPEGKFPEVVKKEDFLKLASNIILEPNLGNYNNLKDQWKEDKKKETGFFPNNNPQLINRAIAACTKEVSVLVNEGSFKKVLDYLQDEEIINEPPKDTKDNWFAQNKWLMEELHNKLEVFYSEEIDEIWLNMFLWSLYEYIANAASLTDESSPNIILYGPPGTGKTYQVKQMLNMVCGDDDSRYEILQFHPSFTYEDFIEGIKPKGVGTDGNIEFGLVNGVFKKFCMKARDNQDKDYYFVVDEINRANLSSVFGETLSLLERDYRHDPKKDEGKTHLIKTQYSSMVEEKNAYKFIDQEAYFGVPKNVFFIGMMNDVDKSIDTFDLALRRRFKWIRKDCDDEIIENHTLYKGEQVFDNIKAYVNAAKALNKFISGSAEKQLGLSKSYEFGHSFFLHMGGRLEETDGDSNKKMGVNGIAKHKKISGSNLETLFDEYLRPTLKEYLRAFYSENEIEGQNGQLSKALEVFKNGLSNSSEDGNEAE